MPDTKPTYIASALNGKTAVPDTPSVFSDGQKQAITRQLVLPFGNEGKVEPAIHIHATAAGYRKTYQAIADAMNPEGEVTNIIAKAIKEEMPELGDVAAYQSAKSYAVNRRNQALGVKEAFAEQGEIVQGAVELSARLINKERTPESIPVGDHTVLGVIEDKHQRLEEYAKTPMPIPRETDATHAFAFASGHIPMHRVLSKMFEADSPLVDVLANAIAKDNQDLSPEAAKAAAIGYLDYGKGMAQYDVEHLPQIAEQVMAAPHAGYEAKSNAVSPDKIEQSTAPVQDTQEQLVAQIQQQIADVKNAQSSPEAEINADSASRDGAVKEAEKQAVVTV